GRRDGGALRAVPGLGVGADRHRRRGRRARLPPYQGLLGLEHVGGGHRHARRRARARLTNSSTVMIVNAVSANTGMEMKPSQLMYLALHGTPAAQRAGAPKPGTFCSSTWYVDTNIPATDSGST